MILAWADTGLTMKEEEVVEAENILEVIMSAEDTT